jgi:hypothetical protein
MGTKRPQTAIRCGQAGLRPPEGGVSVGHVRLLVPSGNIRFRKEYTRRPGRAALALWKGETAPAEWLKTELAKRLKAENVPEQEMRDDAARDLRRTAETLYRSEMTHSTGLCGNVLSPSRLS